MSQITKLFMHVNYIYYGQYKYNAEYKTATYSPGSTLNFYNSNPGTTAIEMEFKKLNQNYIATFTNNYPQFTIGLKGIGNNSSRLSG